MIYNSMEMEMRLVTKIIDENFILIKNFIDLFSNKP